MKIKKHIRPVLLSAAVAAIITLTSNTTEAAVVSPYDTSVYNVSAVMDVNQVQATKNGWGTVDGKKYFAHDNKLYSDGVYKIGKEYYGFDSDGVMYDNEMFYGSGHYDESGQYVSGGYYRAAIGGKLLKHTWYGFYHYDANAKASYGFKELGGKKYYFGFTGEAYTDTYVYVEEEECFYHAAKDGVVTKVKNTGLIVNDASREDLIYLVKGEKIYDQMKTINGNEYYINSSGYFQRGLYRIGKDLLLPRRRHHAEGWMVQV